MFISSGSNDYETEDLINDILFKCIQRIDNKWPLIKKQYYKINKEDAHIICSYTCEALNKDYNPYKLLNENLVSETRYRGIRNINQYLFIFLQSLRKLEIYKPKGNLYRCLKNKVNLRQDPYNENWIPYKVGNQKIFWGFTSTSPNIATCVNFLHGKLINLEQFLH